MQIDSTVCKPYAPVEINRIATAQWSHLLVLLTMFLLLQRQKADAKVKVENNN
jgi:hypothetical protein